MVRLSGLKKVQSIALSPKMQGVHDGNILVEALKHKKAAHPGEVAANLGVLLG